MSVCLPARERLYVCVRAGACVCGCMSWCIQKIEGQSVCDCTCWCMQEREGRSGEKEAEYEMKNMKSMRV